MNVMFGYLETYYYLLWSKKEESVDISQPKDFKGAVMIWGSIHSSARLIFL